MDSILTQVYQLEKELIENKTKYENFAAKEVQSIQNVRIFEASLEELARNGNQREVFQPLGKAFLLRKPQELVKDLQHLKEVNTKGMEEDRKMKENFGQKKAELEKQLIELTHNLKRN